MRIGNDRLASPRPEPGSKNLIVVDAATGERITNVCRFTIDREQGEVVFQPQTVPGEYYIYYLKNVMSGSPYYPTVNYPAFENTASADWVRKINCLGRKHLPFRRLKSYSSRQSMS